MLHGMSPFFSLCLTKVPYLTAELLARGYVEEDVAKILGGNAIRVLAKVYFG